MRAHYKNSDHRILGLTTQVPIEWFGLDALRTLCAQFAVGNKKHTCNSDASLGVQDMGQF